MPIISQKKQDKIQEQILHYLFSIAPAAQYTNKIAEEIARDEEFVKSLLLNLKSKNLVMEVTKNSQGTPYLRRQRWRLSNTAHSAYQKHQPQ